MKLLILTLLSTSLLGTELTIKQLYKKIKENNPEYLAARFNLESARNTLNASYSTFLPDVSASTSYSESESKVNDQTTEFSSYSSDLGISINLFNGLADLTSLQKNENSFRISKNNLKVVSAQTLQNAVAAVEDYRLAVNAVKLNTDIANRREENSKIVSLRFNAGYENKGSLLLSKAYYSEAKLSLFQAENDLKLALRRLSQISGVNISSLKLNAPSFDVSMPENPSFNKLMLETPKYKRAVLENENSQKDIQISKADFMPSLDLTSSFGISDNKFWGSNTESQSLGITLTFPLFDGGRDYYEVKAALSDFNSNKRSLQNTKNEIVLELQTAYQGLQEALKQFETDKLFKDAAVTRAKVARNKYNNGLLTFEDWDVIENDLIQRETSYLRSLRNVAIAKAAWENAQGIGLSE